MHSGETFTLHGLADDLGVEADALRRHLVRGVSAQLTAQTADAVGVWNDGANDLDFFTLDQQGGPAPSKTLTFKSTLFGMVPMSNTEDMPGIDYAVSGQGADDDVVVKLSVSGVLQDNQPMILLLSGSGFVPLPQRTAEGDLQLTFTNTSGATKADVSLAATMRRVKSGTSAAGRVELEERGIPVGRAQAALLGTVATVAEEAASTVADTAPAVAKLEAAGRGGEARNAVRRKVAQVVGQAMSGGMLRHAERGARKLFGVGSDDGERFAKTKKKRSRAAALKLRAGGPRKKHVL